MSLVFSLEIFLNQIEFHKIGMVIPSISVTLAKTGPAVLWTAEDKVKDGEIIQIDRPLQIMFTTDVFSAIDSWPFQVNLTMPTDQVPLGTCTFEFKPLLASALAACGASPYLSIQGVFRNQKRAEIATISFDTRILYYPGTEHNTTVEIVLNRPMTQPPPREDYYRPDLGNSSSISASGAASNASVETITDSQNDSGSSHLGDHCSFKNASEANKAKLAAATDALNSQNSMMRRNSAIVASPSPRASFIGGQRSGELSRIQGTSFVSNQASRRPSSIQKSMFSDDFDYDE